VRADHLVFWASTANFHGETPPLTKRDLDALMMLSLECLLALAKGAQEVFTCSIYIVALVYSVVYTPSAVSRLQDLALVRGKIGTMSKKDPGLVQRLRALKKEDMELLRPVGNMTTLV
jgi:hypothetical protein